MQTVAVYTKRDGDYCSICAARDSALRHGEQEEQESRTDKPYFCCHNTAPWKLIRESMVHFCLILVHEPQGNSVQEVLRDHEPYPVAYPPVPDPHGTLRLQRCVRLTPEVRVWAVFTRHGVFVQNHAISTRLIWSPEKHIERKHASLCQTIERSLTSYSFPTCMKTSVRWQGMSVCREHK